VLQGVHPWPHPNRLRKNCLMMRLLKSYYFPREELLEKTLSMSYCSRGKNCSTSGIIEELLLLGRTASMMIHRTNCF